MAEALVSVLLEELASILTQQVETGVQLVVGVEDSVQKLTSNFTAIKAVLEDAENRQVKEIVVRDWLDKLKDVSYDVEDLLDEWNTAVQKLHVMKIEDASNFKKMVRSLIPAYRFSPKQIVLRRKIATKIKSLNKTLDHIAREKNMFGFSLKESTRELERPITTSFADLSKIHGRNEDKDKLVGLLLSGAASASIPIISIVGMGGLGKTTLARLVYHHDRVNTHFDEKIWVCVSDPFDEIKIAKAVLESLEGAATNLVEYENILRGISQTVENKKFLLVLDDVWTENSNKWEQLKHSLQCASKESRILLTTRKENVARIMRTTYMIPLGKLPLEECWSLFSEVVFSQWFTEEYEKLEEIGRKIVSKCDGLPLAVKTVGSLLSIKPRIEQWQSVLESEMWKLEETERGLFPPLLLSYYDLPSNLRKCFCYCAVFPKDYVIEKNKLIKLWMAQGYLRVNGREDKELIGEEYFENLAMRSFFQDFETHEEDGSIISCQMHDIVHDFAQYLTKNECLTIEVDDSAVSGDFQLASHKALHSMIRISGDGSFPLPILDETKLQSLVIECHGDKVLTSDILSKLFHKLKCIRAMDLDMRSFRVRDPFEQIEKIPREIGKLVHLRYLSLRYFPSIEELPETLCDLYNLQTLDISYCVSLKKLPEGLGKLVNLRHLINIRMRWWSSYLPKGMERLTGLRSLSEFAVSGKSHGGKACTFECFKNFKYLRGDLQISGLGNVTDIDEVKNADFISKRHLLHLKLVFNHQKEEEGRLNVLENEVVLEALQPPPNIEKLEILLYDSKTMAINWMVSLTNLKILELKLCQNLERLPSLGELSSLESLTISDMESLHKVGFEFLGIQRESVVAFPKLKYLVFQSICHWEEWDYQLSGGEDIEIMPCLRSLKLYDCPQLETLPDHILQSTTLEPLAFTGCPNLKKRYRKWTGAEWDKISYLPNVCFNHFWSSEFDSDGEEDTSVQ